MTLKLSMLAAAAVIAMPVPADAQPSSGSNSAPKAQQTQSDADAGLTPAERASKKTARPKAKTPSDVTAPDAPATTSAPAPAPAPATAAPQSSAPAPTTATPQSNAPGQTGTTPGQAQTTPGEASQLTPAVTGQTPSGQSVPNQAADNAATGAQAGQVAKATAADIKAGASVYDEKGGLVGKIVSSSAKGAVLDTGTTKVTIPTSSFAKSDKGLVIGTTKSAIDAAAKPTTAKAEKTAKKPKD